MRDLDKAEAEGTVTPPAIENLGDVLQQAISEYTSNDDPEACCDMIETMLSNRLVSGLKQEDISGRKHILQNLNHICLTA